MSPNQKLATSLKTVDRFELELLPPSGSTSKDPRNDTLPTRTLKALPPALGKAETTTERVLLGITFEMAEMEYGGECRTFDECPGKGALLFYRRCPSMQ